MNAKLGLRPDGRLIIEALDAKTDVATAALTGGYMPSSQDGEGKIVLDLPDLSRFSTLAGTVMAGRSHFEVSGRARKDTLHADWQGTIDSLGVSGVPEGLAKPKVTLSGGADLQRDQSWKLDAVRIASEALTLEMSGRGRDRTGEVDLSLALPKLGLLQDGVGGSANSKGKIVLKPAGADFQFNVDLAGLSRGRIASRRLSLALAAAVDGDAVSGSVKATGDLANQPLALDGRFARKPDGSILVPAVNGGWASAAIDAKDLAVTPTGATGSAHLRMAKLEDLSPLLGTPLAGSIDLRVATEPDAAGKVKVTVRGNGLRSGAAGVGDLQIDANRRRPAGRGRRRHHDQGQPAERRCRDQPGECNGEGQSRGDRPDGPGARRAHQRKRHRQDRTEGRRDRGGAPEVRGALPGHSRGARRTGSYESRGRAYRHRSGVVSAGGGRAAHRRRDRFGGDGPHGRHRSPAAQLAGGLCAGQRVEGTLQAKVRVLGPMATPRIEATYSANGLRIKRPETALLPALGLQGSGALVGQQATFDARITAGGGTNVTLKGKATLPQGNGALAATVALSGGLDLAPFSPALGTSVRGVAGTLRPDLTITVNGKTITGSGTMTLNKAALSLPDAGLRLTGGQATLALQGDTLRLERLAFQTARNGELSASGTVRLDPAQGFPVDIAVTSRNALLVNRPDLLASVSTNIKVSGSSISGFDASGTAIIDRAEISIGVGQAASYPVLPVREINGTSQPDPGAPPPPAALQVSSGPPVRLSIKVEAPQAVFVRGRGLDAEVGGQFTVTGDPNKPSVIGSLSLRRGTFNLAGHRLAFTRGNVALETATTIDPLLDFVATTTVNSTVIEVDITGTSRVPKIALTSTPQLPQDEAMAMLLFGKPASGLSPFEVLSAAQALAELTGKSPVGGSTMGKIRSGLGLDQLSVNSSSSGDGQCEGRQHHDHRRRPLRVARRLCRRQAGRLGRFQPRRRRDRGAEAHQDHRRHRRRLDRQGRRQDGMGLLGRYPQGEVVGRRSVDQNRWRTRRRVKYRNACRLVSRLLPSL